ncbi:Longitudinals lacking protein, isoform G [Orchesella cincta]|uniref:Longitudinals lacking protein, isoform G n=1 Tax=Orchesella cincta TaxID=48709 RepID=A0A1D2MEN2_ORCCI|nr:Longitudinals lacking protein, isoform G [Orchesella cincta]
MEDQFNVRWNDHTAVVIQSIVEKLERDVLTDVGLTCEGRTLKCHRLILAACSTYFDKVLSEFSAPNLVIFINNMKFWELEALVNFMYRGEVTVSQEKLGDLCKAADQLKIKGLAKNVDATTSGIGPAVKDHLDNSTNGFDMVDLLHYGNGSDANPRAVSGGQHHKSLLRPKSNLPTTRKLQKVIMKEQQESPRFVKVAKLERSSQGSGTLQLPLMPVKMSSPTACHLRSEAAGGSNDGSLVGVVSQLPQNGVANSIFILNNEGAFSYFGGTSTAEKNSQNQEVKKEETEPPGTTSLRTAAIPAELKTAKTSVGTSIPAGQSSPSTTSSASAMESVDKKQRLEQAAMHVASSNKSVKQVALEYDIPRTTLCAYMKRNGISAYQLVSTNDTCTEAGSGDQNFLTDHGGQEKNDGAILLGTNGSVEKNERESKFDGITIDID